MKKWYSLLVITLLLLLLVAGTALAGDPVCEVTIDGTTTQYTSLSDAFSADGDTKTIKLLSDVKPTVDLLVDWSKSVTLDMNGKTIDLREGYNGHDISVNGNLTIVGTGTVVVSDKRPFMCIYGTAKFEGDVTAYNPLTRTEPFIWVNGNLEITGNCQFTMRTFSTGGWAYLFHNKASYTNYRYHVNISNGTYRTVDSDGKTDLYRALYVGAGLNVSLTGGTFYGINLYSGSETRYLSDILGPGYAYKQNGRIVSLDTVRSLSEKVDIVFDGKQQEELSITVDDGVTSIYPESSEEAEVHTITVTGGSGTGAESLTVRPQNEYLTLSDYDPETHTATITVKRPPTGCIYTLTAAKECDSQYFETFKNVELLLVANLVEECTVTCEDVLYDGGSHVPSPVVTLPALTEGGDPRVLVEGRDYEVECAPQYQTGTHTYKIVGMDGVLSGEGEYTWHIVKTPFDESRISAKILNPGVAVAEAEYLVYDTVKGTRLEAENDFTSNYQPAAMPGKYTFQLTGIGLYEGTIDVTWSKVASIEDCEIAAPASNQSTPIVTVRYGEKTLVKGEDYTVTYPTVTGVGVYTVTVTGMGVWSGEKTVEWTHTMALNEGSFDVTIAPCVHTGEAVTPEVTVTARVGDLELVQGTDYTVEYANNTDISEGKTTDLPTATITGLGLYQGTIVKNFEILNSAAVMVSFGDGTKYYPSFDEAFKALYQDSQISAFRDVTITLLSDQETAGDLLISNKILTLRLNGHTLSNTGCANAVFGIMTQGDSSNYTYLYVYGPGSVTSENSVFSIMPKGRLIVKNASVTTTSDYASMIQQADSNTETTINGSRLTSMQSSIINQSYGKLTVTGSTLTTGSSTVIETSGGTATISSSTFSSTGYYSDYYEQQLEGGCIISIQGNANVTINGGQFTTTGSYPVSIYAGNSDSDVKLTINGGTFTGNSAGLDVYGSGASVTLNGGTFTGSGALSSDPITLMSMLGSGRRYTLDGVNVDFGDENNVSDYIENHPDDGFTGDTHTVKVLKAAIDITPVEGKLISSFIRLNSEYTYTGEEIKPDFEFRHHPNGTASSNPLIEGTEYTAEITNNLNVGTATITITGIGDYTGTATKTFAIVPAAFNETNMLVLLDSPVYDDQAHTPKAEIIWGDQQLTDCTVELLKDGEVITSATEPGTYTVKITPSDQFTGTIEKQWTLQKKDPTTEGSFNTKVEMQLTDDGFEPVITLSFTRDGSTVTLTEGTDYTVSYTPTLVPGTYTAAVKLCGYYTGTAQVSYEVPTMLKNISVRNDNVTWNGTELHPILQLKNGSYTLVENVDYVIGGDTGKSLPGLYDITVTGQGSYYGVLNLTWRINQVDLSQCDVELTNSETIDPGIPGLTLTYTINTSGSANQKMQLTENEDYRVRNTNAVPGNAYILIEGMGCFTGVRCIEWTMYCADHNEWTYNADGSSTCNTCGYVCLSTKHPFGDWVDGKHTCTICGMTETCTHRWGIWQEGRRKCQVCDMEDVCKHNWENHGAASDEHQCSNCKMYEKHDFSEWVDGSCSCKWCDRVWTCNHSFGVKNADGDHHSCIRCGKLFDHTWSTWANGSRHCQDTGCKAIENCSGHSWSNFNGLQHYCTNCWLTSEHEFGDWKDGERTCTVCEYVLNCTHSWTDDGNGYHLCSTCKMRGQHNISRWSQTQHCCSVCKLTWDHKWIQNPNNSYEHICVDCNSSYDHDWSSNTDDENVCRACTVCGVETLHNFVQSDEADYASKHKCRICNTTADHNWGEWDNGEHSCTKCSYEATCQHETITEWVNAERHCTACGMSWICSHQWADSQDGSIICDICKAVNTCDHVFSIYNYDNGTEKCESCGYTHAYVQPALILGDNRIIVMHYQRSYAAFTPSKDGVYRFVQQLDVNNRYGTLMYYNNEAKQNSIGMDQSGTQPFTRYLKAGETIWIWARYEQAGYDYYGMLPLRIEETTCEHSWLWIYTQEEDGSMISYDYCTKCRFTRAHVDQILTLGTTELLIANDNQFPFTAEKEGVYAFSYDGDQSIIAWIYPEKSLGTALAEYSGGKGTLFYRYLAAGQTIYLRLKFVPADPGTMSITVVQSTCEHAGASLKTEVEVFDVFEGLAVRSHQRQTVKKTSTGIVCPVCGLPSGTLLSSVTEWVTEDHTWKEDEDNGKIACSVCAYENVCEHTAWTAGENGTRVCDTCGWKWHVHSWIDDPENAENRICEFCRQDCPGHEWGIKDLHYHTCTVCGRKVAHAWFMPEEGVIKCTDSSCGYVNTCKHNWFTDSKGRCFCSICSWFNNCVHEWSTLEDGTIICHKCDYINPCKHENINIISKQYFAEELTTQYTHTIYQYDDNTTCLDCKYVFKSVTYPDDLTEEHRWFDLDGQGTIGCLSCNYICQHSYDTVNDKGQIACRYCADALTCEHEWAPNTDGEYVCGKCGIKCPHRVEGDPDVYATHDLPGSISEKHCTACGKVFAEYTVIPARTDLKLFTLPKATKMIEEEAFMGSAIQYVVIPEGCTKIGAKAFANCAQLYMAELPASVTYIAADAFAGTEVILLVPDESDALTFATQNNIPYRIKYSNR